MFEFRSIEQMWHHQCSWDIYHDKMKTIGRTQTIVEFRLEDNYYYKETLFKWICKACQNQITLLGTCSLYDFLIQVQIGQDICPYQIFVCMI